MAGTLTNLMILVRPGTDYRQLSLDIESSLRELDPDYPLDIHLFNNIQENLYQKELLLGKQILFFSLIAVFVSLVGVFGVVLFESEYKRKEIGIRKVFGATVMDLLRKHNLSYLWIVMICFVIASPIAWYGIERWQENFALKAPLHWWFSSWLSLPLRSSRCSRLRSRTTGLPARIPWTASGRDDCIRPFRSRQRR